MALLRWLAPAKMPPGITTLSQSELARRYKSWEVASILPLFTFTAFLGYGWFLLIRFAASLLLPAAGDGVRVVTPEDAYWAVPAGFLGLVSSARPLTLLYGVLLKDRYAEYDAYTRFKLGFDSWALFRVFAFLVPLMAAAFLLAGINYSAQFDERGITTRRFWGAGGGLHSYEAVTSIHTRDHFIAPNGNRVLQPHYVIEFSDGTAWTTRDGMRTPDPANDLNLMEFVALKSGRTIEAGND
jgi:hypothetical protein